MARFVKVASIPDAQLRVANPQDYEACAQEQIAYWQRQLDQVADDKPDLIVTPEYCDLPSNINEGEWVAYYRAAGGKLRAFFTDAARKYNANIACGSMRELADGTFRNSIQFINRHGEIDGNYDKYVLVIEEYTKEGVLYGEGIRAIDTDVGRVCGAICFDLNHLEPRLLTAAQKPEILVFSSMYHGGIMQAHWAYTCRAYMITCTSETQAASVINPVGEVVAASSNYYPYVTAVVNLDYIVAHLDYNREKFREIKRKYGDAVEIRTPYGLGSSLLTCLDPDDTMKRIAQEFEIEPLDDYFTRAIAARNGAVRNA